MKNSDHLPLFGIGPVCVYSMVGMAIAGIVLHCMGYLDSGVVPALSIPFKIAGGILIALGIYIWCSAVFVSSITREIKENHLVTTGIYAFVRNPVYSAVAIALWGILLMFPNLWLLLLPPLFWLDITLFMILTEEKWLLRLYGEPYADYCRRVNRCIPWFPKK